MFGPLGSAVGALGGGATRAGASLFGGGVRRAMGPSFNPSPSPGAPQPGSMLSVLYGDALRKRRMTGGNQTMPVPFPGMGSKVMDPGMQQQPPPFFPGMGPAQPGLKMPMPGTTIEDIIARLGPMMQLHQQQGMY